MIDLRTPDDWAAWLSFIDWLADLVEDLEHRVFDDSSACHWWDS